MVNEHFQTQAAEHFCHCFSPPTLDLRVQIVNNVGCPTTSHSSPDHSYAEFTRDFEEPHSLNFDIQLKHRT